MQKMNNSIDAMEETFSGKILLSMKRKFIVARYIPLLRPVYLFIGSVY